MIATSVQLTMCALLSLVSRTAALNHVKYTTAEHWNPLGAITTPAETKSAAPKQNGDSNSDLKQIPFGESKENERPPLMLVAGGCDGSGAIVSHAHFLLEAHGIENQKILAEKKDPAGNDKAHVMVQHHKDLQEKNQTLLFKVTVGKDHKTITAQRLFAEGTKVAVVTRANTIDQVVCLVKDCLFDGLGHPVVEGGEESHVCEERRNKEPKNYKALVATNALVSNINKLDEDMQKTTTELKALGYDLKATFTAEDLLDFEWNSDRVGAAQASWTRLLKLWGVSPNQKILADYFEKNAHTHAAPLAHSSSIYNFGIVKGVLMDDKRLSSMLRESASEPESEPAGAADEAIGGSTPEAAKAAGNAAGKAAVKAPPKEAAVKAAPKKAAAQAIKK